MRASRSRPRLTSGRSSASRSWTPLLTLLRVGAGLAKLDEDLAVALLSSPLGGADALDVRRLRRALHERERAGGREPPSG